MPNDSNTGFENRPWPDAELDSVSPWPPQRSAKRTPSRFHVPKAVIGGVLMGASGSVFLTAFHIFLTTW